MSRPSPDTLVGKRIGKFRLTQLLGRGATADVYAAVTHDGKWAAMKVLSAESARDSEMLARFEREAQSVQRLDHRHIVKVFHVGSYRGRHYMVMELMRGGSLRQLLKRKTRHPERIVAALAQVARALAYAHEQGVVHRDMKPENVLLKGAEFAKVSDFGLAHDSNNTTLTTDGRMLGTLKYIAPEQARGQRAGPASDVYSCGVMLYEALTGTPPFESENPFGLLYKHAEESPARPRVQGGFRPSLARLAMRCLAKDPMRRPPMAELAHELELAVRWRPVWRRARVVAVAAAAMAIALGALLVTFPDVLDPVCRDKAKPSQFCAVQRAAERVQHFFGGGK